MYKNQLQEYCQKNQLDFPRYVTVGSENEFFCTVEIVLRDKSILESEGEWSFKKKEAEMTAAKNLLNELTNHLEKKKITIKTSNYTRILIDLENVNIEDLFIKYNFKNFIFDVFISNESCLKKLGDYRDRVNIHKIKSSRRDAADILMILHIGFTMAINSFHCNNKTELIVLTNDHFGDALIDCLDNYKQYLNNYHCVNSVNDLIRLLIE